MVKILRVHPTAVLIGIVLVAVLVAGCTLNVPSGSNFTAKGPLTTVIATPLVGAAQNTTAGPAGNASTATAATTGGTTIQSAGTTVQVPADTTGATQSFTPAQSTMAGSEKGASTVATAGTVQTAASGPAGATTSPTPTTCTADFTGSPRSGSAPLTVTFTALNPCTVWQHMWIYGDGTLFDGIESQTVDGSIATVTHTYTSPGTYTVHLLDDDGRLEDGEVKTGYITVTAPGVTVTPTTCPADFTGSPRSGAAPLTVTFTALNPCTVWQHMWDFGDGSEIQTVDGSIATVTHTYTHAGTYTVHVLDDDGRLEDGELKTNYITVTAGSGVITVNPSLVVAHPTILPGTPGLILTTTPTVKSSLIVKNPTNLQADPGLILTTTPASKITVPAEIPNKPVIPQL